MLDSIMHLLGTPQANVTVATSRRRKSNSNSTAIDIENSPEISNNMSSISSGKTTRENSMSNSETSYSDVSEQNVSLFFKHNIDSVDLGDPSTQKYALQYLLQKVNKSATASTW